MMLAAGSRPIVVVAMSGGVDSSVAAGLLLKSGRQVIGATMWLWGDEMPASVQNAQRAAAHLGIPLHVIDLRREFSRQVIQYLIDEYAHGRTPNPCLACNRGIKFGRLLTAARQLGGEVLATGHYVRNVYRDGRWHLLRGLDRTKDQSYMLYMLGQEELGQAIFPLGELTKSEVRRLARQWNLPSAEQAESQEICFLPNDDYRHFLRRYAPETLRPGPILDSAGREIGRHAGLPLYTVGQRKGLGITSPIPLYVIGLDAKRNAVIVGPARELGRRRALAEQVNYVAGAIPGEPFRATVKIRYKAIEAEAEVRPAGPAAVEVHFVVPQRDITPGQGIVFYREEEVLGGGIISASLP